MTQMFKYHTTLIVSLLLNTCLFAQTPAKYKFNNGNMNLKVGATNYTNAGTGGVNTAYISTADLDNDGKLDLIIYDRNQSKYLTFINNGNNTNSFDYNAYFENFLIVPRDYATFKDFNNDGKKDLFYKNEFDYLCLKINITKPGDKHIKFKDYGVITYYDRAYLYDFELNTRKSDLPVLEDLDGDGDLDFLDYNPGIQPTVQYFKNQQVEDGFGSKDTLIFEMVDFCWGQFSESSSVDKVNLNQCPTNSKFYRHLGGASLFSYDFDNDGDFDMLMGNTGYNGAIYLQNGRKENGWWQDSIALQHNNFPNSKNAIDVNTMAFFYMEDLNNDGKLDFIVMPGDLLVSQDVKNIEVYYNSGTNALPVFTTVKEDYLENNNFDLGSNTSPALWDYDNDNDDDLFVATSGEYTKTKHEADRIILFKNNNGVFEQTDIDYANFSGQKIQDLTISFGDIDGDKKMDLVYGKRNGEVNWKKNTGTIGNPSFTDKGIIVASTFNNATSFPTVFDYNEDGINDLIIGNDIGNLYYYKGKGSNVFELVTDTFGRVKTNILQSNNTLSYYGFSTPVIKDINKDGNPELITGTHRGSIKVWEMIKQNPTAKFREYPNPIFVNHSSDTLAYNNVGNYAKPAIGYIDKDTLLDIIVGTKSGGLMVFYGTIQNAERIVKIKEINKIPLSLFPNPSRDKIIISRDGAFIPLQITIINSLGQIMETRDFGKTGRMEMSISNLDNGLYFIYAKDNNGVTRWSNKIIKE